VTIGYPSVVEILGELVESGKISVSVLRVVSCGEPLSGGLREYFERIFNTVVINYYEASEALVLGTETNSEYGMYLFDNMNYFEIIDDKIYVTCLYNFAQPLIRYEISDKLNINKDFELVIESDKNKKEIIKEKMTENINKILTEKNLDNVQLYIKFIDRIMHDKASGKKRLTIKKMTEMFKMKRILLAVMGFCMLITSVTACSAQDINEVKENAVIYENNNITVVLKVDNPVMTVNGKEININENNTSPVIVSGRTLVPARGIILIKDTNLLFKI